MGTEFSTHARPGPRSVIGEQDDRHRQTRWTEISSVQYAQQQSRLGKAAKTGVVPEKQRRDFEKQTRTSSREKETTTTATQTASTYPRADRQTT